MPAFIAGLRPFNVTMATRLYDRVNELLVLSFLGRRMRLPCPTFKLGQGVDFSDQVGTWFPREGEETRSSGG